MQKYYEYCTCKAATTAATAPGSNTRFLKRWVTVTEGRAMVVDVCWGVEVSALENEDEREGDEWLG